MCRDPHRDPPQARRAGAGGRLRRRRALRLPAEYLRVESPSAEVQGHGPGQKVIVAGRRHVGIMRSSRSATTPSASSSTTCTTPASILGLPAPARHANRPERWAAYEQALAAKGLSRDPPARRKSVIARPAIQACSLQAGWHASSTRSNRPNRSHERGQAAAAGAGCAPAAASPARASPASPSTVPDAAWPTRHPPAGPHAS